MSTQQTISRACHSVGIASVFALLSACSSVPVPAVADGSSRVPANDPKRVESLQQQAVQDRALLTENNLLKAQVDVLQQKLNEMTTIMREALTLPPPEPVRPQVTPAPGSIPQQTMPGHPISGQVAPPTLPAYAFTTNSMGVVIRVFHQYAQTEFEPSEAAAQALRASVHGAEHIEVRGHTDSNVVDPLDRLIAIERAAKARNWLIDNGADAAKITTYSFTAGHFLAENRTQKGRAMNRRVEIEIRNPQLSGNKVALSD